jgi:AcrR family transcriptional regulator
MAMTPIPDARPPRTDAKRNRERLIKAATEAFAEQGIDVSIAEIAQRAGVGKGTVFRHFAAKGGLVAAIMGQIIDCLIATCRELDEINDDPSVALRQFMTAGVELLARNRALCDVIGRPSLQYPAVRVGVDRLCDTVDALTTRARHAGVIRQDVTGQDIVLLLSGINQAAAPLADSQPNLWRRYLALILDGLQTETPHALPHPSPRPFSVDGG